MQLLSHTPFAHCHCPPAHRGQLLPPLEDDSGIAIHAKRQDGVREAGWGWAVLEKAGGAETFIANGHGKFLTFMSHSSCLKGTEIEQGAIRQQVWSSLRPGK